MISASIIKGKEKNLLGGKKEKEEQIQEGKPSKLKCFVFFKIYSELGALILQ